MGCFNFWKEIRITDPKAFENQLCFFWPVFLQRPLPTQQEKGSPLDMFNAMKYIRALEATGVRREQAEAHMQLVFDAMEGEFVTKADFASFKEHVDNRFSQIDSRFDQLETRFDRKLVELEFRMTTRLGFLTVSTTTIAVAVLAWIIKLH